jgi:hypothetical protein
MERLAGVLRQNLSAPAGTAHSVDLPTRQLLVGNPHHILSLYDQPFGIHRLSLYISTNDNRLKRQHIRMGIIDN